MTAAFSPDQAPGRPLVFRNATVLTMDDGHHVHQAADVLIEGERISAIGPAWPCPTTLPRSTRAAGSSCRA